MPTPLPNKTDDLFHLAFDNSAQANIISTISNGKIIVANSAACKLLGYSKKEMLTKTRAAIFDINDAGFKKMLKERTAEGHSIATVKAIRKTGKTIICEITSAVFTSERGIKNSITSIANLTDSMKRQKQIDDKKEKKVAKNINAVKLAVKKSALKRARSVAKDKATVIQKQLATDLVNEKTVQKNIYIASKASEAHIAANNAWIKYIAKSSYDVMWDWNIVTGSLYIGDSIEEVFGFKVKNNSVEFGKLKKVILTSERNKVLGKLKKTLKSGSKSWSDSFTIKKSDDSPAFVNSRGSIVRDQGGKAIRMIGATQDVSRLRELEECFNEKEAIQKENDVMFHLAAKLSYDGIWDWNIETNEFFLGEGFEEMFGYPISKEPGSGSNWNQFLHPEDKAAVEHGLTHAISSSSMSWEDAYRFIKADGTVANVYGRASIIRDAHGKATRMIGAIHDLSRQKELEAKLESEIASAGNSMREYEENLWLLFNSSSDILFDLDITTDHIMLSDGYEKEFGYPLLPQMKFETVWTKHLHPEDKIAVLADYQRMLNSTDIKWNCQYRFLRADDSIASIVSNGVILRNPEGKAYRMIGAMQDITKQTVLEEKLQLEIKLKEKQINDAMHDAHESARSDIGRELHDNVNQLLGVSRLYLEMAKQGGADSKDHLTHSSEYTMAAIEEIRKLTLGLSTDSIRNLGLCNSIENLADVTMEVNSVRITCVLDPFVEEHLHDKFKLNLYRIIQEQLNNILKHARAKHVSIRLFHHKKSVTLAVKDDGIGFDPAVKRKGVGVDNIKSRAAAFYGQTAFATSPGNGCTLRITFNLTDDLFRQS